MINQFLIFHIQWIGIACRVVVNAILKYQMLTWLGDIVVATASFMLAARCGQIEKHETLLYQIHTLIMLLQPKLHFFYTSLAHV